MHIYPLHFTAIDRTPFTYFIRHKISKMKYYGCRTAKGCKPEQLWSSYFTSSKIVKQIIKQEGKDIFDVVVARIFDSSQLCKTHETNFLFRHKASEDKTWYNQTNGDKKFSTTGKTPWNIGIPRSAELKRKLSEHLKNQKRIKCLYCDVFAKPANLKQYHNENCTLNPRGAQNRLVLPKKECTYCHKSVDPGNFEKYHDIRCKQNPNRIPFAPKNKCSSETRSKISNARKNKNASKQKCNHCGKTIDTANFKRWHGPNCKSHCF